MSLKLPEILIEEIENKKSYPANYDTTCDPCGGFIAEGESFYFFGNKRKTCENCYQSILEYVKYGTAS